MRPALLNTATVGEDVLSGAFSTLNEDTEDKSDNGDDAVKQWLAEYTSWFATISERRIQLQTLDKASMAVDMKARAGGEKADTSDLENSNTPLISAILVDEAASMLKAMQPWLTVSHSWKPRVVRQRLTLIDAARSAMSDTNKVAKTAIQSSLQLLEVHPWLSEQKKWMQVLQERLDVARILQQVVGSNGCSLTLFLNFGWFLFSEYSI